ncbi:MAG: methionyl-tRNA formyltransferase [Magnetococcales bacterium]|nr:methionyl-tRNA formyltransferase [Magnetococcales bacterium]
MTPWRVVFMGTPQFAVPSLQALITAGYEVVGVFTRPDKPVGRGMKLQAPPVKELALANNIPVFQPLRMRNEEAVAQLRGLAPDVVIVAAYGQILSPEVLAIPPLGCINVHASLLPRWRGADPIRHAILAGDSHAGVTIMGMDVGLDTGPMFNSRSMAIPDGLTGGELYDALAQMGGPLLVETLELLQQGKITPTPQPDEGITYAGKVDESLCQLDWQQDAPLLRQRVLAFSPLPGCFTTVAGGMVKLFHARLGNVAGEPGLVVAQYKDGFEVACGTGSLVFTDVQPAGKRRMAAGDWLRGRGSLLGEKCQ